MSGARIGGGVPRIGGGGGRTAGGPGWLVIFVTVMLRKTCNVTLI
jgi:hypothetical protein